MTRMTRSPLEQHLYMELLARYIVDEGMAVAPARARAAAVVESRRRITDDDDDTDVDR